MNKGLLLKIGAPLLVFAIIIVVAIVADNNVANPTENTISNPSDVFVTVDGIEITNDEIWSTMKNVEGLDYLIEYVEKGLLADYISQVTQDEVDKEILYLTYYTYDEEAIAEIQADEELNATYLDNFSQNLAVLGFDASDAADLKAFVELGIAKRLYARELIENAEGDTPHFISHVERGEYYADNNFGDVCTIDLRFSDAAEADEVFEYFNLVPNYNNGIGEYINHINVPYDEMAKGDFDETNTLQLDDDSVFNYYIKMWNLLNPWETPIPENISQEDYCANYSDIAVKDYNEMTDDKLQGDPNIEYAGYIFDTLDLDDEFVVAYTFVTSKTFGNYTMMTFKVSQGEAKEYEDLTDTEKEANFQAMLDDITVITDNDVASIVTELLEDNDFEIFDTQFKLQQEFSNGNTYDNNSNDEYLASYGTETVTADELYEYMLERIGTFYSLEVAKVKILINSDLYVDTYGESRDYMNNDSDKMKDHREELLNMKSIFSSNGYAQYGYPSTSMTWNEFLFLAFGLEGEEEVMEKMFVVSELQYAFTFDKIKYETGVDYMQDVYDNYLSLNVNHILLYIDYDFDFEPDGFNDYVDSLTGDDLTEFNNLKKDFEDLLIAQLEENTMAEIIEAYNTTLINDTESIWQPFKAYGFLIMTENLGEINSENVENLDDAFGEAAHRIYESYVILDEEDTYIDDRVVVSDFGIHFLTATKGEAFAQPSAKFTSADGDLGDYSDGVYNEGHLPTKEQVMLFLQQQEDSRNEVLTEVNMPESVEEAISAYYGGIYDAYMTQTAFSIAMGEYAQTNGIVFATDDALRQAELTFLLDSLFEVNYPELFDKDAE